MCTKPDSISVEILYSLVGYTADPQAYIVGAQISAQTSQQFYRESSQVMQHHASIVFRDVYPGGGFDADALMEEINGELFYP